MHILWSIKSFRCHHLWVPFPCQVETPDQSSNDGKAGPYIACFASMQGFTKHIYICN